MKFVPLVTKPVTAAKVVTLPKSEIKPTAPAKVVTATNAVKTTTPLVLKKDGTPDMRFKNNKKN